jgi:YbbR domain-containing protein
MREVATERLALKGIALLLAALLWVVVGARQPTEGYVRVKVLPELDSSLVLLDGTPELQALVAGRAADLVKLYAAPLVVRRRVGGEVPDTLVLDVTPADVRVPPDLAGAIRVVDLQPRSVRLRFESSTTSRVPVANDGRIRIKTDSGVGPAGDAEFEPRTVRVTGPRRAVRRLRAIRPYSLSLASDDTLQHVADLDTTGTGVRVQPTQVKVRLQPAPALPSVTAESTP